MCKKHTWERRLNMRKQYLEEVLNLTKKQSEVLSYKNLEDFEEILNQKQLMIEKIEALKEQGKLPLTEEEREILVQIQEIDTRNRVEYEKQLQDVKDELKRIRTLKARENYFNSTYNVAMEEGIFLDKREYMKKY